MLKDKVKAVRDYVVKHSSIIFPVLVVVVVAATVVFALKAKEASAEQDKSTAIVEELADLLEENIASSDAASEEKLQEPGLYAVSSEPEDVPLVVNEDQAIYSIVASYYNAMGLGDYSTLVAIYDEISENDILRYVETAKYIDYYTALDVYTKPGFEEGSTLAYVYYKVCFVNHEEEFPGYQTLYICTNEAGELYIKSENNFTAEEIEYIRTVTEQADVVEFNNRVNVEYEELMVKNPELLEYLAKLGEQVNAAIGVALAGANGGENQEGSNSEENTATPEPEQPAETGPMYATATTTVNVRSSDSEMADKLGKVSGGTKVTVQEVQVNGWTKIVYEGKDGYIKSEYLKMQESAENLEVIGKVTANSNINIRTDATETSSRLGVLVAGDSLELLGNENGWCKVIYNGQVAYVKADYVTQVTN